MVWQYKVFNPLIRKHYYILAYGRRQLKSRGAWAGAGGLRTGTPNSHVKDVFSRKVDKRKACSRENAGRICL